MSVRLCCLFPHASAKFIVHCKFSLRHKGASFEQSENTKSTQCWMPFLRCIINQLQLTSSSQYILQITGVTTLRVLLAALANWESIAAVIFNMEKMQSIKRLLRNEQNRISKNNIRGRRYAINFRTAFRGRVLSFNPIQFSFNSPHLTSITRNTRKSWYCLMKQSLLLFQRFENCR